MRRLKKEVVLFDLDGTIIDSIDGIMNAIFYCFDKMGHKPITLEDFLPYVGPPIINTFKTVYNMAPEIADETMEHYHDYYREKGWKECSLYPEVRELLMDLKKKNKIIALATNKPQHYAKKILADKGVDIYFDYIGGADPERGITNKTLVIEDCLKKLSVNDKKNAVMIGDRKFDVEGSIGANVDAIGVTYGYGDRHELETAGAVIVVDTPKQVSELFE